MRQESLYFLESYLDMYVHEGVDSIYEFYKYYSSFEVHSINDLMDSVNEFCEYLRRNVSSIKRNGTFSDDAILKTLESFKRSISVAIQRYSHDNYKNFAKLVYELSPSKEKESVLEVGSGKIPSSSIWLKEKVDKVLTIDTEFYLSKLALENMNVQSKEHLFGKYSNIDGASFVVGRCPCSAIKHMVKKCAEKNIPYLIKLCDCDIVASNKFANAFNTWSTILPEYDPEVKIFNDFAYNLDVSKEQIAKIISLYDSDSPRRARRPVRIVRCYDNGKLIDEKEEMIL